jgi:hypothetical protein
MQIMISGLQKTAVVFVCAPVEEFFTVLKKLKRKNGDRPPELCSKSCAPLQETFSIVQQVMCIPARNILHYGASLTMLHKRLLHSVASLPHPTENVLPITRQACGYSFCHKKIPPCEKRYFWVGSLLYRAEFKSKRFNFVFPRKKVGRGSGTLKAKTQQDREYE